MEKKRSVHITWVGSTRKGERMGSRSGQSGKAEGLARGAHGLWEAICCSLRHAQSTVDGTKARCAHHTEAT